MKFTALLRAAVCVEVCVKFTGAYIYIYMSLYSVIGHVFLPAHSSPAGCRFCEGC